jgi:mono/diheme cytochrome c family protein
MCHSPINALGGTPESQAFQGGLIPMQNWYAPSLTSNKEAGLGERSIDEIVGLLRTGVSRRGAVYGPMAEVTSNSLQYLSDADVRAMAIYLKSLAEGIPPAAGASGIPAPESSLLLHFGQTVYETRCASCHGADGRGMPPDYPPLAGNPSIQMESAVNPVRMVLNGGFPPGTAGNVMPYGMPPFAQSLSDDEVAGVVTYRLGQPGRGGFRASGERAAQSAFGVIERC